MSEQTDKPPRCNYLSVLELYNLRNACEPINRAFCDCVYQVGSSLWSKDYRDVDVRCILFDEEYARLFPAGGGHFDAAWAVMCNSISEWLHQRTGLPIDFQFQQMSAANVEYPNRRDFLSPVATKR